MVQTSARNVSGRSALLPGYYLLDPQGRIAGFTPVRGFDSKNVEPDLLGDDFFDALKRSPIRPELESVLRRQLSLGLAATPLACPGTSGELPSLRLTAYPVKIRDEVLLGVTIEPSVVVAGQPSVSGDLPGRSTNALSNGEADRELSAKQLAALLAVSAAIHAGEDTDGIFRVLAREAKKLIPFDRASITLLKQDTHEVEVFALTEDERTGLQVGTFTPSDNTVTAWVVKNAKPVVTQDLSQTTPFVVYPGMRRHGYRAALCYPLTVEGQPIGTMNFTSRTPNQYTQAHVEVASQLTEQAAIAIQNVLLRKRLERQSAQLRNIIEVGNEVKHHLSLEVVLDKICGAVRQSGWKRAVVMLHDEARQTTHVASFSGDFTEAQAARLDLHRTVPIADLPRTMFDPNHRISRSFILDRTTETPLHAWHGDRVCVVPLAGEGRLLGLLSADEPTGGTQMNHELVELLELFGDQTTIAVRNAGMIAALRSKLDEVEQLREQEHLLAEQMRQSEKLRALGEIATGVAHNFNNLLTIILGRTQLLKASTLDSDMLRQVEIIEQSVKDAAKIVRRIQDFTRLRSGTDDFEPTDLVHLADEVIEMTQSRCEEASRRIGRPVEIVRDFDPAAHLLGNATELREILTNLIINAVDAMPDGGRITVGVRAVGDHAELSVRDTGTGMTEEIRQRIFTPFFSTKREHGTGLGLSLTLNLVNRHRGQIQVVSTPGEGTTFTVLFPAVGLVKRRSMTASGSLTDCPRISLDALVIDDDPQIATLVARILESFNHHVVAVTDPREAVDFVSKHRFDIVLTDLEMPELSGWEIVRAVRRQSPETVVVLVTGNPDTVETNDSFEMRADFLIRKPFDVSRIHEMLAAITIRCRKNTPDN